MANLLPSLMAAAQNKQQNFNQAISGMDKHLEMRHIHKLGKEFIQEKDFSPENIMSFAQERNLEPNQMKQVVEIASEFMKYKQEMRGELKSWDTQDPDGTKRRNSAYTGSPGKIIDQGVTSVPKPEAGSRIGTGGESIPGRIQPYTGEFTNNTLGGQSIRTSKTTGEQLKDTLNEYTQKKKIDQKYSPPKSGGTGNTGKIASDLRKEFIARPGVKSYEKIRPQIQRVEEVMSEIVQGQPVKNLVATDQALIMIYNKMLDENSVVRESEYARTSDNISFINKNIGRIQKQMSGGNAMSNGDRMAIYEAIQKFKGIAEGNYKEETEWFGKIAEDAGLSRDSVIRPMSGGKGDSTGNSAADAFLKKRGEL